MTALTLNNSKIGNQEPMTLMGGVNVLESELIAMTVAEQFAKAASDFNINWISKFLILKIWDSNQEDGDKINLTVNGSLILKDYETKNRPKKIKYKLLKGNNIIKIKATSSGSSPPNTSRIELIDKNKKYPILIQLDINKSAIIKINK